MDSLISGTIESIGRYFIILSFLYSSHERAFIFLFKKNALKQFKEDKYRYTFFIYTFLLFYFLFSTNLKLEIFFKNFEVIDFFNRINDSTNAKFLIIFCLSFLLCLNFITYFFSKDISNRKLIRNYATYIFCTQILSIIIATFFQPLYNYLDADAGVIKKICRFIVSFMMVGFTANYLFIMPFGIIKMALQKSVITKALATKLKFFIFVPTVISILLFQIIPSEKEHKDFEVKFIDGQSQDSGVVRITSNPDSSFAIKSEFILINNTNESYILNDERTFFMRLWLFSDTSISQMKERTNFKTHFDTLYLKAEFSEKNKLLKKDEPFLIQINSRINGQVLNYIKGDKTIHLFAKTLEGKIISLYSENVKIFFDDKLIN
jgi:hypothetical protein